MSKRGPLVHSYLYGKPVTEWSTPPPLNTKETVFVSQFQGISLEDEVVSQKPSYEHPVSVNPADAQLLNHPSPAHLLSALESHCAPTTLTALNTHVTQSKAINRHHQVFPKSVGLPIGETKPKSSNGSQIPTALVTPLPGSSPPRHSAEYQMQVGGGVEEGEELRNMGWGKRTTVKTFSTDQSGDVSVFPVAEDSQELHAVKKWKCLIDTKDLVMKQKDAQIESLKNTISKLQQGMRENKIKLHQVIMSNAQEHGGSAMEEKLQTLETANASIRLQLAECMSLRKAEVDTLSSKLDLKEYEFNKTIKGYVASSDEAQQQMTHLHDQIHKLQEHTRKLESKLAETEQNNVYHLEQIERLNDYLGHMPSMEEHQALEQQSKEMRALYDQLEQHLERKEMQLQKALIKCSDKVVLEQCLEEVKKELEETRLRLESHQRSLELLEPENRKLRQECHHLQKVVVEADRRCRQELQDMRERHRQRFVEATAKLRLQHKNLVKWTKALEAQLSKNSDAMLALNSELQLSHGTIGALKTSVKDLVTQNQQLVERNISLQEVSSEAFKMSGSLTEAHSAAAQQLGVELSRCVEEFESLVNLSSSLLDSQEPTAAMLFGPEDQILSQNVELPLEARLEQVKKLREKIEQLRTIFSEHFAAQLSSACNVQ